MICLIKCLNQVGCCFCLICRQRCTKYTGQQGSDVPDSPTGHGGGKIRRRQPQMETCHQMCRTRDRIADRVRGIKQREFALLSECAVQTRSIALLPECAEYRTSLSARINQKTRLVVGTNTDLALNRVRENTVGVKSPGLLSTTIDKALGGMLKGEEAHLKCSPEYAKESPSIQLWCRWPRNMMRKRFRTRLPQRKQSERISLRRVFRLSRY